MISNHLYRANLFVMYILIFVLYSINVRGQEFNAEICRDELAKKMRELIQEDESNILNQAFNIANLKLTYKLLETKGAKKSLEEHVKSKLSKLAINDKVDLIDNVKALYKKYGQHKSSSEVLEIINNLDDHNYFPRSKRLSNQDAAVVMLVYELLDPAKENDLKINDNDVAITWFFNELSNQVNSKISDSSVTNYLQSSVKVAHATGLFQQTRTLTTDEIRSHIDNLEQSLEKKFKKVKKEFLSEFSQCQFLLGGEACVIKEIENAFDQSLYGIINDLKTKSIVTNTDDKYKIKLIEGLTLNLKNSMIEEISGSEKSLDSNPPEVVQVADVLKIPDTFKDVETGKGGAPLTCGGVAFKEEIRNISVHGADPNRAREMWKNFQKHGKLAPDNHFKGTKLLSLLGKLCGPIPWLDCYPWVKFLTMARKIAEANVCCKDELQWVKYGNMFLGASGGLEAKAYIGLPDYIPLVKAKVGVIGGLSMSVAAGGGDTPQACGKKFCVNLTPRFNASLGVFMDLGVQAGPKNDRQRSMVSIGVEGKLVWKPYASGRICWFPKDEPPHADAKISIGNIWADVTFYAGWLYTYDKYWLVYEFDEKDTLELPIF